MNKKTIIRRGREYKIIRSGNETKFRLYVRLKRTWVQVVRKFESIKEAEIYTLGFENKIAA